MRSLLASVLHAARRLLLPGVASAAVGLSAAPAAAQYATFAQRQQALINGALNNYSSVLNSPTFGGAEAFFMNNQPTQGLAIVNASMGVLESNPNNFAGDLQFMLAGMECYLRYGSQWDAATVTRFENFYTTFTG